MKFDENLAAIHAYLCADGYVIRNPPTQKQKYYRLGFRNTNLILLKDFQKCFDNYFGVETHLRIGERCDLGSKEIYERLTEEFGSFYSWEWRMPQLNKKLIRIWLRAYFDCEGWVFCKHHQDRHIGADCVNKIGLKQVEDALNMLGIKTHLKFKEKRNIYRISIYGKDNIVKFRNEVGFLHPDKLVKLNKTIEDFVIYLWDFPTNSSQIDVFIKELFAKKAKIKRHYSIRLLSREHKNLFILKNLLKKFYSIESLLYKAHNGIGAVYYELDINRKEEVQKLIDNGLIPNIFKLKKS